jgi:hypothetical protein
MFDPKALLPIIKSSFPKATPEQLLEALTKLANAHPDLTAAQALAALQKVMQEKEAPSIGMMARKGAVQ